MKPMLLFYGYFRFRPDKPETPVARHLFETKQDLRNAIAVRYGHLSPSEFDKRCMLFRCYAVRRGTKIVKLYDTVSKMSLFSDGV